MKKRIELSSLLPEEAFKEAFKAAGELLSARPYSRADLLRKLRGRGFSEETAESVLIRLTEMGILDDRAYAELIARHYAERGYGPFRIRQELARRGIGTEEAKEAAEEAEISEEEIDRLLREKLRGDCSPSSCRRAVAALLRRGYRMDQLRPAIARLTGQIPEED